MKKTINDLVHLLLHKSPAVPGLQPESARSALIKLAQLLNNDTTPTIKEVQPAKDISPAQSTNSVPEPRQIPTVASPPSTTNSAPSQEPPALPVHESPSHRQQEASPSSPSPHSAPIAITSPSRNNFIKPKKVSWKLPISETLNCEENTHNDKITKVIEDVITKILPQPSSATSKGVKSKVRRKSCTSKGANRARKMKNTNKLKKSATKVTLPHRAHFNIPTTKMQRTPVSISPKITTGRSGRKRIQRYDYAAPTRAYAAQYLALTERFNQILHMFDKDGEKETLDSLLQGPMAKTWKESLSNELGRLAQGIRHISGNDVIDFISYLDIPKHKKVTYANMVCDYRPLKSDPYRVRLTVGGDRLDYFEDTASPAATLLETKLLLNSVILDSDKNARFMTIDIKAFFLQTFMN